MKRILLIMVISLCILTAGCGLKYSGKEMSFEDVELYIDGADKDDIGGYLEFIKVHFKNKDFKIWVNIEKTKIEIEHRIGLNGTILTVTPDFCDKIFGVDYFLQPSQIKIICGSQENVNEWKEMIKNAKQEIIRRREQRMKPKSITPPKIRQ